MAFVQQVADSAVRYYLFAYNDAWFSTLGWLVTAPSYNTACRKLPETYSGLLLKLEADKNDI